MAAGHEKDKASFLFFWSRGNKKDHLIAGVVAASHDSLGRPFPLLLVGETDAISWQQNWPYLVVDLYELWEELRNVIKADYQNLSELSNRLTKLNTLQFPFGQRDEKDGKGSFFPESLHKEIKGLARGSSGFVPLKRNAGQSINRSSEFSLSLLQQYMAAEKEISAIFLSGREPSRLFFTTKSLSTADFVLLWKDF